MFHLNDDQLIGDFDGNSIISYEHVNIPLKWNGSIFQYVYDYLLYCIRSEPIDVTKMSPFIGFKSLPVVLSSQLKQSSSSISKLYYFLKLVGSINSPTNDLNAYNLVTHFFGEYTESELIWFATNFTFQTEPTVKNVVAAN